MILRDATEEAFGYIPKDITKGSRKLIIASCELCGEFRVTTKHLYRTFCHSCSCFLGEALKGNENALGCAYSEETKALMSKNHANFRGMNNPRWKGGISFEPYCIKFNKPCKQLIRNKFNNSCFWCSMTTEENGRALDVHHVNYNKQCECDETKCICVPLCKRCHSKTNTDRDRWQEKIMKKLELSGILLED